MPAFDWLTIISMVFDWLNVNVHSPIVQCWCSINCCVCLMSIVSGMHKL